MIDKGGKSWFSGEEKQFVPREMKLWRNWESEQCDPGKKFLDHLLESA